VGYNSAIRDQFILYLCNAFAIFETPALKQNIELATRQLQLFTFPCLSFFGAALWPLCSCYPLCANKNFLLTYLLTWHCAVCHSERPRFCTYRVRISLQCWQYCSTLGALDGRLMTEDKHNNDRNLPCLFSDHRAASAAKPFPAVSGVEHDGFSDSRWRGN